MESLNYHHLHYFAVVAREGSVAAASRRLGVGRPAISAQVRSLERSLGVPLLRRVGRGLELTPAGRAALVKAEEIFERGRELVETVRADSGGSALLRVGVANVVAKLVAFRLLSPVVREHEELHLVCYEDEPRALLGELALGKLDAVLSDAPLPAGIGVRGETRHLGSSGVLLMGTTALVEEFGAGFPRSLTDAPLLLPTSDTALRRSLDHWFAVRDLRPRVRAEFDDSALMKAFGQGGLGLFPAPSIVEQEIRTDYGVSTLGSLEGIQEEFFAIVPEPQRSHALLGSMLDAAEAEIRS